jgi:excisionase family DNA binding protein
VREDRDTTQDRVSIQEAARRLGVKEDAIRKRIQRGTLRHEKTDEGRVFVWVDRTQGTTEGTYRDATQAALLDAKDETFATLREQLQAEREANRENRRIIAALTSPMPELEAPSTRPPEGSQRATEGRVEPTPSEPAEGPMAEDTQGRPWWRRMFGS